MSSLTSSAIIVGPAMSIFFQAPEELIRLWNSLSLRILWVLFALLSSSWATAQSVSTDPGVMMSATELSPSQGSQTGFQRMDSSSTGVRFVNQLSELLMIRNINLLNGSGLSVGDFDQDGLLDLFFSGLQAPNKLYRNLGEWRFEDVTERAGVANPRSLSTGAAFVDLDADGWPDLVSCAMGGPNSIFMNQRNGTFKDVGTAAGITSRLGATSMAFADIDQDGDLDYYQSYYGVTSILKSGGALNIVYRNGKPVVRGRHSDRIRFIKGFMMELGEPDQLFINDGDGGFEAVEWTQGRFLDWKGAPISEEPWDQGLSVRFSDLNQDGLQDIYVCNDAFTPDRVWLNMGNGIFKEPNPKAFRKSSYFSMGMDVADVDLDQRDDLLVVDMLSRERELYIGQQSMRPPQERKFGEQSSHPQHRRNTFFWNRGDGTYAEIAWFAGLAGTEWSWSPIFMDVDLDGDKDLLVSNGFPHDVDDIDTQNKIESLGKLSVRDSQKTLLLYPALDTPNRAYRNEGQARFVEVGQLWGFDSKSVSNGMVTADLDGDGDLDLALNCFNGEAELYQNLSPAPRVQIKLIQMNSKNRDAIGARIRLMAGDLVQSQEVIAGGRYMSGEAPEQTFAFPDTSISREGALEVNWPDGFVTRHAGIRSGMRYFITRDVDISASAGAENSRRRVKSNDQSWFIEADSLIEFQHHEVPENDFSMQPMLLARQSQDGPGIGVFDWNGDGLDDVLAPSGQGGISNLFLSQDGDSFKSQADPKQMSSDGIGVVAWKMKESGMTQGLISLSHTTALNRSHSGLDSSRLDSPEAFLGILNSGTEIQWPKRVAHSLGALAVADFNQDGELDLFAGGRPVPGRFPEYSESWFYFSNGQGSGEWLAWSELMHPTSGTDFPRISSAIFSDVDQDGQVELIVAEEWGRLRILKFSKKIAGKSQLKEIAGSSELAELTGCWGGIASADLDNDGDLDLVVGNMGWNTRREKLSSGRELRLYFGDADRNGALENWEVYYDSKIEKYVPFENWEDVLEALPAWKPRFDSHKSYSLVSAEELFDHPSSRAYRHLSVNTLGVKVLWNEGENRWTVKDLPGMAQWAPVFGVTLADWNGDGAIDIFLAQNFFALPESEAGMDAGTGLVLQNLGSREWRPMLPGESGISILGEQRGSATGDLNGDGRPDLVVAQNAAKLKVYLNQQGSPGLRVRIHGGKSNPWGVGHRVRFQYSNGWGPMQEVQFGSGYASQNSGYLTFRNPGPDSPFYAGPVTGLEWSQPGGSKRLVPMSEGTFNQRIKSGGILELK